MRQQERSKRKDPSKRAISGSEVNKMNAGTVTPDMAKAGSIKGKVGIRIDGNTIAFIDPSKDEGEVRRRYESRVRDYMDKT
jgi:hypothetical protein